MGQKQTVDRSVIKSSSISEKAVTLGLKMKFFNRYMETIFPKNFQASLKKDLIDKVKERIEMSDSETVKSDDARLNAESNIINDDFYIFFYAFENLENEKINIAYQFINGKIEVSKKYEFKTLLGIKYGKKYECITDNEKTFYQKYFDVKADEISNYLQEQKKNFLK